MRKIILFLVSAVGGIILLALGYIFFLSSFAARALTAPVIPPTPTVTIGGTAALVTNSTTAHIILEWSSQNASSCTASGAWSGIQAPSGESTQIPASTGKSTYTI